MGIRISARASGRRRTGGAPAASGGSRIGRTAALGALALTLAGAARARAQSGVWAADSLLAAGQLAQAESMYYAASSANPRDPAARAALGRYLAARGALRIGAVLLEEARLFGGDTAAIARALAPIYAGLADYRSLAALPRSPLSSPERARARWLVANSETLEMTDSVALVPFRPLRDGSGLGVIPVRLGDHRIDATLDPRASGLVIGTSARWRKDLRVFGTDSAGVVAVAPELGIGGVTISNVPARVDSAELTTRIGLDVVRRLAPTFDVPSQELLLRRSGQIASSTPGTRIPVLLDDTGMRLLRDGHWEPASAHAAAQLLATRRWTLDPRRGEILLAP